MKKRTSAKEFLEQHGINLNTTAILTVIDNYMRQPDICTLMESYHEYRMNEEQSTSFFNEKSEKNQSPKENFH